MTLCSSCYQAGSSAILLSDLSSLLIAGRRPVSSVERSPITCSPRTSHAFRLCSKRFDFKTHFWKSFHIQGEGGCLHFQERWQPLCTLRLQVDLFVKCFQNWTLICNRENFQLKSDPVQIGCKGSCRTLRWELCRTLKTGRSVYYIFFPWQKVCLFWSQACQILKWLVSKLIWVPRSLLSLW